MLVAPAMGPTVARSSLEVMLDSLRKKDEKSQELMPTLPVRPISKGRLPSSRRRPLPVNFNAEGNELKDNNKQEVAPKVVIFGGRKIVNVEQPEESPYSEMPELVSYEERGPKKCGDSEPSSSLSISEGNAVVEKLDYVLRKVSILIHFCL